MRKCACTYSSAPRDLSNVNRGWRRRVRDVIIARVTSVVALRRVRLCGFGWRTSQGSELGALGRSGSDSCHKGYANICQTTNTEHTHTQTINVRNTHAFSMHKAMIFPIHQRARTLISIIQIPLTHSLSTSGDAFLSIILCFRVMPSRRSISTYRI